MVLAFTVAVVLWGAFVRATGAGAGCGNHWPLCNGEVLPRSTAAETLIEYTHRAMSGIDGVLIFLMLVWAFRLFPKAHPARLGAALSFTFLVTEALIGAALVKLEHVARNISVGRAWSLSGHLINTLVLLACVTLTAWWAQRPPSHVQRRAWKTVPLILLVVVTAISGAIAALGDTLFPATSLASGFEQDFSPAANIFVRLRVWHPFLATAAAACLALYAIRTASQRPHAKPYARTLLALVALQVTAGAANVLLLAPVWMQLLHLLLADMVWIALVLLAVFSASDPEYSLRTGSARPPSVGVTLGSGSASV